jgi:transposase
VALSANAASEDPPPRPAPMGEETYRDRNKIEHFFGRMKQYRRSVKPYDKTKVFFLNIFEY